MKIDTRNWLEFRVGDLFIIKPTKSYKLTNAKLLDNGTTPVVVNSAFNNGIGGYSTLDATEKGNMVTFSDTVDANTIFYQPNNFIGYPHVQGLYPTGKYEDCWTEGRLKFFVSVFRKAALTKGFDYGNKFRRDIAVELKIKLPVTSNNQPDWEYMELYVQKLEEKAKNDIKLIINALGGGKRRVKIDTSSWKRFHLYDDDLFTIDSGTKLDRVKMKNTHPTINFVGRANANNGVTDFIDEIDGLKPYCAGCMTISLGGEYLGSCFIQDKPFYTSQNVNVLIPKQHMSVYCKRFISTMIFREGRQRYKAFIDELNRHMKTDFSILLPATTDGKPDWDYMEFFMKAIEKKAQVGLEYLKRQVV